VGEAAPEGPSPQGARQSRASALGGWPAHLGGGRTAAPWREPRVLWLWWHGPEGMAPNLGLVWRSYVRCLDLEHTFRFLKQCMGWTTPRLRPPEAGRPMDVAGFGSFHPAQAGTGVRCGPKATVGAPLRHSLPDTATGPPRRFGAFGRVRHARQATETLRQIARKAKRQPLWPSQTLPGPQEGRLSPRRQQARSFVMSFISIAKLLRG
jgi:hypothetical protein